MITNSEPLGLGGDLGGLGSRSGPGGHGAPFNTTSYTSPFLTGAVTTTAAPGGGISGINDLLAETTMYNSFSSGKTFKKLIGDKKSHILNTRLDVYRLYKKHKIQCKQFTN